MLLIITTDPRMFSSATETSFPHGIGQHDHRVGVAGSILVGQEKTPEARFDAKQREVVRRDDGTVQHLAGIAKVNV